MKPAPQSRRTIHTEAAGQAPQRVTDFPGAAGIFAAMAAQGLSCVWFELDRPEPVSTGPIAWAVTTPQIAPPPGYGNEKGETK